MKHALLKPEKPCIDGDWVLGYYLSIGMEPEVDFSATAIPSDIWMGHADTFAFLKEHLTPIMLVTGCRCTTPEAQKRLT